MICHLGSLCSSNGIPVREVASSWSRNELWEEAFITSLHGVLAPQTYSQDDRKGASPRRERPPAFQTRPRKQEPRTSIPGSLRILQHVESIQVPLSWKLLESESEKDVTWVKKQFREAPGKITALIQREIMKKVGVEGYGVTSFKV
ncbi:hypothetical protein C3L33_16735, partial [Rhododendron williamsianum]